MFFGFYKRMVVGSFLEMQSDSGRRQGDGISLIDYEKFTSSPLIISKYRGEESSSVWDSDFKGKKI